MTGDGTGPSRPNRRDFLKATGAGVMAATLAGCDEVPDDVTDEETQTGAGTDTTPEPTPDDVPPDGEGDPFVARPAAVDTSFATEESDRVRDTFAREYYTRVEGGIPGLDAPEDVTPTGHAVTYGHDGASLTGDPPEAPTVNELSAGILSVPAPEEGAANRLGSVDLEDIVRMEEGNLLLGAAGLSTSVEWLTAPVAVDEREATFLDGDTTVTTFVGAVRGEPGPGMPAGEDAGFFDGDGRRAFGHLVTVHAARAFVGGDLVMMGMVGGWQRPPSMDPRAPDVGPDMVGELSELYEDFVRTALFVSVLGQAGMLAASLMPDPEDRPPAPEDGGTVSESYSRRVGLDDVDQVELGYEDEERRDYLVEDYVTIGRDVPGLLSGTAYDEEVHSRGTDYKIEADAKVTAYPVEGDDGETIPFGVISSASIDLEGEQGNPLAADPLADLLTGGDALWNLLRWMAELGDFDWQGTPTEFEYLSGVDMLSFSPDDAVAFEGAITTVSSDGTTTDDVYVYVGRRVNRSGVHVALALSRKRGTGYWSSSESIERLFREALPRVDFDPERLGNWAFADVHDLDLVQTVSDTRLETGDGDVLSQPDPPLVAGRYTAPRFDFDGWSDDTMPVDYPEYCVVTFDVGTRGDGAYHTVLDRDSMEDLDEFDVDRDVVFSDNVDDGDDANDLPVFELALDDDSVRVGGYAPSGFEHGFERISEGSDYEIADMEFLRVGFVRVYDPALGGNYGGSTGFVQEYVDTVESAFEYLKRTFPTGLSVYRHDTPIEGDPDDETQDYEQARVVLEEVADPNTTNRTFDGKVMAHKTSESAARSAIENHGFDVWVQIFPVGYYGHHWDDSAPSGLAPGNPLHAVTAVDGDVAGRARSAEIVAQEIGHRLKNNPYEEPKNGNGEDNPLAQRDDDGTNDDNRDYDHARHLSSDNDGDSPTDGPGVVSRAYSLAEGDFVVPTHTTWDGGFDVWAVEDRPTAYGDYGPTDADERLGRMESYMSYSGRSVWADSLVTRDIVDSDLNRDSGEHRTSKMVSAGHTPDGNEGDEGDASGVSVDDVWVTDGFVSDVDEEQLAEADSTVEVYLLDTDGDVVAETRTTAGVPVAGHEVEREALDDAVAFEVEFHPEAVEAVVVSETGDTLLNPITRPIRDAFGRLPDEGIAGDPGTVRGDVDELLRRVDAAMAEDDYASARDALVEYVETGLPEAVDPEFEPAANQPDRDRFASLFRRMTGRLDGLADDDGEESDAKLPTGEVPAWADWVPDPAALPTFAESRGLYHFEVSAIVEGGETLEDETANPDPMTNPFASALFAMLLWGELQNYGVDEAILGGAADSPDVDLADVPAERGVLVGGAQVYLGSFDVAKLDAEVQQGPFSESSVGGVYVHDEEDVAVGYGAAFVVVAQTPEEVATVRATGRGNRDAWYETDAEVEWLFGTGAVGDLTLLVHQAEGTVEATGSTRIDLSPFTDASGVAQTVALDGETFTAAQTGVVYPTESAVDVATLESSLGDGAAGRSIERDGRFVTVTADYDG